jgi:hypothetical protein
LCIIDAKGGKMNTFNKVSSLLILITILFSIITIICKPDEVCRFVLLTSMTVEDMWVSTTLTLKTHLAETALVVAGIAIVTFVTIFFVKRRSY